MRYDSHTHHAYINARSRPGVKQRAREFSYGNKLLSCWIPHDFSPTTKLEPFGFSFGVQSRSQTFLNDYIKKHNSVKKINKFTDATTWVRIQINIRTQRPFSICCIHIYFTCLDPPSPKNVELVWKRTLRYIADRVILYLFCKYANAVLQNVLM